MKIYPIVASIVSESRLISFECELLFSLTASAKPPIVFGLRCEPDEKELSWKLHCDLLFSKHAKLPANVLRTSFCLGSFLSEDREQPVCEFSLIPSTALSISRRRVLLSRVRWLSPVWLNEPRASLLARARFLRGQILLPAYLALFLLPCLAQLFRAFPFPASFFPLALP